MWPQLVNCAHGTVKLSIDTLAFTEVTFVLTEDSEILQWFPSRLSLVCSTLVAYRNHGTPTSFSSLGDIYAPQLRGTSDRSSSLPVLSLIMDISSHGICFD